MIPNIRVTPEGVYAPTREEVQAGAWAIIRAVFGNDLAEDERTPQGQLVTSITKIITERDNTTIELANNFDPRYAVGVFQEALGAVYFIDRKEAVASSVELEFTGLSGALIPAGFICIDDNGSEWATNQDATIGTAGNVTVFASCTVSGAIQASAGTINSMKQTIVNVDRVTNLRPAAAGRLEESRTEFEDRRRQSVAAKSWGINASVYGAVFNLNDVIDCDVVDNPKEVPVTVGSTNYPMIQNSLLVSVVGGNDYQIAGQIMKKGGTCCAFAGNTEVTWLDTDSDNVRPPEYEVKFLRPDHLDVYFRVSVLDINKISFTDLSGIKDRLFKALSSGDKRLRIASKVVAPSYMCDVGTENGVMKVEVSIDGSAWFDVLEFGVDEYPVASMTNISVVQL